MGAAADGAVEVAGLAVDVAAAVVLREVGEMEFTVAALILCAAVVSWYLLTYNSFVNARNAVDQAWSHIEIELKRRFDLIQQLVEVAKGYAKYESDTLKQLAALRAQPRPFADAAATNSAQPSLTQTISQIMVLAENYPQLRADQNFLNLQKELTQTENRIADRRHAYNQSVNVYANLFQAFPSNIVAKIQTMPTKEFFDAPDAEVREPTAVKLT